MDSGVATAFRSVRERHGVSVADAARSLGVDAAYLQAIEDGSIERTASEVVARAHVRVYARYLGFDSEAVLRGQPLGTPSPDAPIAADDAGDDVLHPRRRIAPAARPAPRQAAATSADAAGRDDAGEEPTTSTEPSPGPVEVVDDPPDADADLDDLAPGRRRLAALAILGSVLVGLLLAFLISAARGTVVGAT